MIGEEVRRRREGMGLTGARLAARAGMAPSAVSQIETGRRTPSSASVVKLAAALGMEVGDLFPKGPALQPSLEDAALDEVLQESLAGLFRSLAWRARLIVRRSRREGPSEELAQELQMLHADAARIYKIGGQRDVWGSKSDELLEAEDAYQEAERVIQEMLRQDLDATDEERREARMFRRGADPDAIHRTADAS